MTEHTLWAFDIETYNWDTFILGAAVSSHGETRTFATGDEVSEWYRNLDSSSEVLAHYGGGFDFLYLISVTPDLVWTGNAAGSSLITCRAKGHALCRDTTRLFPMSLAKWTGRKTSTGLQCTRDGACEDADCGGFKCRVHPSMPRADWRILLEYCINDCTILLDTYLADVARLSAEGFAMASRGGIRSTLGSVAWATASGMAGIDPSKPIEWGDYNAGRAGYYGGRVEVGRTRASSGYAYDVNAMYPWALTLPVPVGERRPARGREARAAFAEMNPGIYHATVAVPDTDLPLLPHRYRGPSMDHGRIADDRLLWATGTITGAWSQIELAFAVENGAVIQSLEYADVWPTEAPIFRPYVEHAYALRATAKRNDDKRWAAVLKWYANSLSGKLAQQPELTSIIVCDPCEVGEGYEQVGPPDSRVHIRHSSKVSPCALTWCAATLTARARVKLASRLLRHSGRWLYCDTDSTYIMDVDSADVHDSKLGEWGYEGEIRDWRALAPKLYRFKRGENDVVKARGVPRANGASFAALEAGKTLAIESGVVGIRQNAGAFRRRTITRTHKDVANDRVGTRFERPDGTTRPLHRSPEGVYR